MKLLYSYNERSTAEAALAKSAEPKRLASERDGTETVYNLLGVPSWKNFYDLELFQLRELELLLKRRECWTLAESKRHEAITGTLPYTARQFDLKVPTHWL